MNEPWNLRQDDTRQADSLPTFIIFCEDEVSEPIYFKYFETASIKVNTIEGQKSKIDNVFKAILHCKKENLLSTIDGLSIWNKDDVQVWCVFDRDKEESEEKEKAGDLSYNTSVKLANEHGIRVAWSNDAFELWVLLHFEEIDLKIAENKKRKTYYDRLTAIFASLPNPNESLIKVLRYSGFNYKLSLKQKNNFREIVRSEIVDKTHDAINRAKKLEEYHISTSELHEKSPCTMVHHLVEELIRLGGKQVESTKQI